MDPRWSWSDWGGGSSEGSNVLQVRGRQAVISHLVRLIFHDFITPALIDSLSILNLCSDFENDYSFQTFVVLEQCFCPLVKQFKEQIFFYYLKWNQVQERSCAMSFMLDGFNWLHWDPLRWAVKTKDALGNSSCQGASLISQNNEATTQMSAIWIFLPGMFKFEDNYLFAWSTWSKDL